MEIFMFNVMIAHSFAPSNILCSNIIPIPKKTTESHFLTLITIDLL